MRFGVAVSLEYAIEFILLVVFGFIISSGILNFKYVYYLSAVLILLTYISFLLKERKRSLTPFLQWEGWKMHFDWLLFLGLLAPFFPLFIFIILVKMHLDFFIVPTILAVLVAIPSALLFFIVEMLSVFPGLKNFKSIKKGLRDLKVYLAVFTSILALVSTYVLLSHFVFERILGILGIMITLFEYTKVKSDYIKRLSFLSFILILFALFWSFLLSKQASLFSLNFMSASGIETMLMLFGFEFFWISVIIYLFIHPSS